METEADTNMKSHLNLQPILESSTVYQLQFLYENKLIVWAFCYILLMCSTYACISITLTLAHQATHVFVSYSAHTHTSVKKMSA